MAHIHYFTDGSVIQHHNKNQDHGSFGYVQYASGNTIVDCAVGFSMPDIHYLECLAIHSALIKIKSIRNLKDKFTIYSDSSEVYSKLKDLIIYDNKKSITKKSRNLENKMILTTSDLLEEMLDMGYDLHLLCIKSHSNPIVQRNYMHQYGINVTREEARFICKGNFLVDQLVNNTAKFYKAYPALQYIK